ncbi:condensation domain-containing protein [Streptomyces sp. CL12]|uniref:condensation domain-containing protein n=1 Tax=Streptomyces sp. CL12 TaxID=3391744 RepID=UPI003A7F9206
MNLATGRPLSPLQRMLWLLDRHRRGSGVMNVPIIYRIQGDLRIEALTAALSDVEARHEALRTRFRPTGLRWTQVVHPPIPARLHEKDLRGTTDPEAARDAEVATLMREEMDITTDVPYRAWLLRTRDEDHTLVINVHHLVTDAWSNLLVCRDLAIAYNRRTGEMEADQQPPAGWQFGQFLDWQEQQLDDATRDFHIEFWRSKLEGLQPIGLPPAPARPARLSPAAGNIWFKLDPQAVQALRELARLERTTLFAGLLAVFYGVLAAASGSDDLAIGSVLANRTREEVYETVGLFANMVLLRTRLPADATFREVLRETGRTVLEALDHQQLPYMSIPVDKLPPIPERPETVVFHMLAVPRRAVTSDGVRFEGLSVEPLRMPEGSGSRFDMELLIIPQERGAEGVFRFATDQFDRSFVQQLANTYVGMLSRALEAPDSPLPRDLGSPVVQ